jgi:hypothetical protein
MKATDLTKTINTEGLLSQFESRFGQTMNLQGLTVEQLEDMANMVRTKIHEITNNQHFGQELKDENYHKNQMMLDILNQAVREAAGGINTQVSPQQQALAKKIQMVPGIKPQDKDAIIGAMVQKETAVKEGIENQSELILAAKDMMDKVTAFLEDLAKMKTESMLELSDRIRDEMGADKADAFAQKVKPALESAEQTLTATRTELDQAVRILTGEEVAATEPMGTLDEPLDTAGDELDSLNLPAEDEFAATDANAGGTEPEGRQKRESREVFEASTRIYSRLAGK